MNFCCVFVRTVRQFYGRTLKNIKLRKQFLQSSTITKKKSQNSRWKWFRHNNFDEFSELRDLAVAQGLELRGLPSKK